MKAERNKMEFLTCPLQRLLTSLLFAVPQAVHYALRYFVVAVCEHVYLQTLLT